MLTIKPIGSTKDEVMYYANLGDAEHFEYYSEDGETSGVYWGEGAAALGLEGTVDPKVLENLLKGMSPDGSKALVQLRNGAQLKRRAGFDFTFSEVKSFDAAWAIANDERRAELDAVAEKALYRVMDVVQDLCGATRRGKDGVVKESAKLVGAIFHHDTARPVPGEVPDPKKHHHVVIANLVVREDSSTGALDAQVAFQRRMKMAIGALFRAELSKLLEEELGIVTYRPKRERKEELAAWFEIQGVPEKLTKAMSKRRAEIERWLQKHGLSGTMASQQAALRTREKKERYSWSQLNAVWEKRGHEHDFTKEEVEQLFGRLKEVQVDKAAESKKAFNRALESLSEQKARFTKNELLERTAIEAQCCGIGIDDVLAVVEQTLQHDSEIVRLQDEKGVNAYTTKAMLALEKKTLDTATRLHNRSNHVVSIEKVNEVIAKYPTLRPDQAKAVRAIATGGDCTAVIGVAGSGKSFSLSVCRNILERCGYTVIGTALAAKASKGLEKESGIKSHHIHKLLFEIEKGRIQLDDKTALIIEESGTVGTVHMAKLLSIAEKSGAKAVLVGDHKQLQSITAGAPLRAIAEEIGATEIKKNIRQRKDWAKNMVQYLRNGEAEKALVSLHEHGQLIIGEDRDEAMERLVVDWAELVFEKGEKVNDTLVFAGMNADVRELNKRIQEEMRSHGQLGEHSVELDGLNIHLGDQVMVTKNYNRLNLKNGTMGEVTGVEDSRVWILTEDGIDVEINTKEFCDITLGYSMSVHKAQGVTCENALILTGDAMADREWSYVAASRPRGKTIMYSDELSAGGIEELAAKMNVSRQNEMAIEHRLEIEE